MPKDYQKRQCFGETPQGDVSASKLLQQMTDDLRQLKSAPNSFNGSKNPSPNLDLQVDRLADESESKSGGSEHSENEDEERKKKRYQLDI